MIRFRCPKCRQKIAVPEEHAGRACRCPGCRSKVAIPAPSTVPATKSAPDQAQKPAAAPPVAAPSPPGPATPGAAPPDSADTSTGWAIAPLLRWIVLGAIGIAVLFAAVLGDFITLLFVALLAGAVVNGYWLGASKIIAVLGGLFAAALLAVPLGRALEGIVGGVTGATGLTNRLLSIVILAAVVVLAVTAAVQFVLRRWLATRPDIRIYDRTLGAAFGLIEGALLGFLLIWAVLAMEPVASTGVSAARANPDAAPNPLAERVVKVSASARGSAVGRVAETVNPLRDLHLLTLFQKVLVVLNDPVAREAFVSHDAVSRLRSRDSVRQAIDMLRDDPDIMAIIESEQGIRSSDLRRIMDSDRVLEIFDQTTVVAELKPMADEIEAAVDASYAEVVPEE